MVVVAFAAFVVVVAAAVVVVVGEWIESDDLGLLPAIELGCS